MFQDQERFRRHKGACPYYRENWVHGDQTTDEGEILLYEVYCLKGWPPQSTDEQNRCMGSSRSCWRNGESHRITPQESLELRTAETA
ncbi:MAG: hypothetical protein NVS2B16_22900 [Chloroflexota bacterium]